MGSEASLEMKYPLATQIDTTKMPLFEKDDVPLSNPSFFAKKDARGECIRHPDRIRATSLDFWRSRFMCVVYQGLPRLEVWGRIIRSLEGAQGQKSSVDGCLFHMIDSRVIDPASRREAARVTSTLKPYLHRGNES
jgi:hypothetical protein